MQTQGPPYNPVYIANYFIEKAHESNQKITPLKLQKLVYFAHGWYLALAKQPLINETVEAWPYGPVIPGLYQEFKAWGKNNITKAAKGFAINGTTFYEYDLEIDKDDQIRVFLDKIWNKYGKLDGYLLSAITHLPGSPWDKTRKAAKTIERGKDIDENDIRDYFLGLANG